MGFNSGFKGLIITVFYLMKADGTFKNRTRREILLLTDYVTSPVFCTKDSLLTDYVTSTVFCTKDSLLADYVMESSLLHRRLASYRLCYGVQSFTQKTHFLLIMLWSPVFCTKDSLLTDYVTSPVFFTKHWTRRHNL